MLQSTVSERMMTIQDMQKVAVVITNAPEHGGCDDPSCASGAFGDALRHSDVAASS